MTVKTRKIIDLLCEISNRNGSLATAYPYRDGLRRESPSLAGRDNLLQIEDEIRRYEAAVDGATAKIRALWATLNEGEKSGLR
jgi:hypothetical protein